MYTFIKGVLITSHPLSLNDSGGDGSGGAGGGIGEVTLNYIDSQYVPEYIGIECSEVFGREFLPPTWSVTIKIINTGTTVVFVGTMSLLDITPGIDVTLTQPSQTTLLPGQFTTFTVSFNQNPEIIHVGGSVKIPTTASPFCALGFNLDWNGSPP